MDKLMSERTDKLELLLEDLEGLRIDIDVDGFNQQQSVIDSYERANQMLDDCIRIVLEYCT